MVSTKRITLRDVAEQAGVSRPTVSLALRNDPRLPPPTRQRIQALARRLGYFANPLVSLVMAAHRTSQGMNFFGTLGFVTAFARRDGWRTPTFLRYYEGAEARARQLGFQLEVFWLREPRMTGRRMMTILQTRGVRGLIIAPLPRGGGHLSLDWGQIPAATLGYSLLRPDLHRAANHHFHTLFTALRHLKRLGYRRIGLTLLAEHTGPVRDFWKGAFFVYQDQLPPADRIPPLMAEAWNERAFTGWFKAHRPEAIVGGDPSELDWLKRFGRRVPEDVGYAHIDWSPQWGSIAGMDQNCELVGSAAVDLVVGQLHRGERGIPATPTVVLVEGRWVDGQTVRLRRSGR